MKTKTSVGLGSGFARSRAPSWFLRLPFSSFVGRRFTPCASIDQLESFSACRSVTGDLKKDSLTAGWAGSLTSVCRLRWWAKKQ